MNRREPSAVPGCSSSSSTEHASRPVLRRTERRFKYDMTNCVRCYNHGIIDQIKDQDHFCRFRACKCDKCTRFSEYLGALPAENDTKEKRVRSKRPLAQEKKASATAPLHAPTQVKKTSSGAGGNSKAQATKSPRGSADPSIPKLVASAPGVSTPEDGTKSFSFHEVPHALSAVLSDAIASDPDFDTEEWERKLMAAEALLTLKNSSWARGATTTQPGIEAAKTPCPDVKPPRN